MAVASALMSSFAAIPTWVLPNEGCAWKGLLLSEGVTKGSLFIAAIISSVGSPLIELSINSKLLIN